MQSCRISILKDLNVVELESKIINQLISQLAVAFPQSGSSSTESKLEFRTVDFCGGRKNRKTQRKTFEERERTNKQLYLHMTPSPGIEPGTTKVRGERSHRYATHASRNKRSLSQLKDQTGLILWMGIINSWGIIIIPFQWQYMEVSIRPVESCFGLGYGQATGKQD
jgi:hypothetical protein